MPDVGVLIFMVCVGFIGSAVNAVAGGGSFIAFPAMLEIGLTPVIANISNKIAFAPGSLAAAFSTYKHLNIDRKRLITMCIIGVIGSTIGTIILKYTGDQKFSKLVPLLLLFATILLWLSPYINRYIKYRNFKENNSYIRYSRNFLQIFAAIYGGFFGAGVGIILLASLGISGMTNMKEMNAAKNLTAFFINITALIIFIASSKVAWAECIAQMIGAIAGGFWGGMLVSKLPDNAIRYFVLGLGIFLTIRYAYIYY